MKSRELVYKTLEFDNPKRIPRQLWLLPWAEINYPRESSRIRKRYPDDIVQVPGLYNNPIPVSGGKYGKGTYIDEWGCKFDNPEEGLMGIVHEPLIRDWDDLKSIRAPEECLDIDKDSINRFCRSTDKFTYAGSIVRPFERFQFLRTMEQSFIDIMLEEDGYLALLDFMHQFYCREIEVWAQTDVDAIFLMDDWGTQDGLMVSPDVFRRRFKPMYCDYCDIARLYGKKVFMHSDGHITEIIEDLIECGVDAINSQLFCMDIKELGEKYKGRISFWGEIDRQEILPNATKREVLKAVMKVYDNLYDQGGVIAQCEFGPAAKPGNIETVFKTWGKLKQSRKTEKQESKK